jgi:hypothetical protein
VHVAEESVPEPLVAVAIDVADAVVDRAAPLFEAGIEPVPELNMVDADVG